MPTDVRADHSGSDIGPRRPLLRAWVVLGIGVWNVWVWATRLVNAFRDEGASAAADVVHGVLFSVSLALGVVLVVIGWRMRREARG